MSVQLDVALTEIHSFDVIAFASRYAVPAFWERMKSIYGGEPGAMRVLSDSRCKFATVPTFARQLRERLSVFRDRIIAVDDAISDLSDVLSSTAPGASVLCIAPVFEVVSSRASHDLSCMQGV
jgi:uroporphyrinogen-III synthase